MAQPQSNADQIAFWNGDAGAKWVKSQERLDAMFETITPELLKTAAAKAGERVLDVGCGCGDTSLQLAAKGAVVSGVDISDPMLARARQRAKERDLKADFVLADAAEHRFEPQQYDLLFS